MRRGRTGWWWFDCSAVRSLEAGLAWTPHVCLMYARLVGLRTLWRRADAVRTLWLSAEDGGPLGGVKPHFHVADSCQTRLLGCCLLCGMTRRYLARVWLVIAAYDFQLSSTYVATMALSFVSFLIALLAKLCRQTLQTLALHLLTILGNTLYYMSPSRGGDDPNRSIRHVPHITLFTSWLNHS